MRREFSAKVKAEAHLRAKGCCELCRSGVKLMVGDIHYDHRIPDGLGGEPVLQNCQLLCRSHHDHKTRSADVPAIAKSKRIRRREQGIKPRSQFACSRQSPWRKKVNGEVVRR